MQPPKKGGGGSETTSNLLLCLSGLCWGNSGLSGLCWGTLVPVLNPPAQELNPGQGRGEQGVTAVTWLWEERPGSGWMGAQTMPWNVTVPPASPTKVPLFTGFKSSLIQQKSSGEGNKPLGTKGRAL